MKGKFWGLAIIMLSAVACNKHDSSTVNNNVCGNRLTPKATDHAVAGADLDSIRALFSANNLSIDNLQFQYWDTAWTLNTIPGQFNGHEEQVVATQYFNGLPVFGESVYFTFYDGVYQPDQSSKYTGPAPVGDTTGHRTLAELRKIFLSHISESYRAGGLANSKPFIPTAAAYENDCLTVTLGYMDAGMTFRQGPPLNKALVKVWAVTPASNPSISFFPLVYVEDGSGTGWGVPFLIP
jgi:hypothetical protein